MIIAYTADYRKNDLCDRERSEGIKRLCEVESIR